jgi:hypothetical protein
MPRKPGLSLERHREIGRELADISDGLVRLAVEIGNAYPRSSNVGRAVSNRTSRSIRPLCRDIDKLRSELEDQLMREHPNISDSELTEVYYPRDRNRIRT